jgi:RNA-binding protein 39
MVMQLPRKAMPKDVIRHFSEKVGKVRDVKIIADRNSRKSKGIAYIEFQDVDSVAAAIAINGQRLKVKPEDRGAPLIIMMTQSNKNRQAALKEKEERDGGPSRIACRNLPFKLTSTDLKDLFMPYATEDGTDITEFGVLPDPAGRGSSGVGFVVFGKPTTAAMAVQAMDKQTIIDRKIRVELSSKTESLVPGANMPNINPFPNMNHPQKMQEGGDGAPPMMAPPPGGPPPGLLGMGPGVGVGGAVMPGPPGMWNGAAVMPGMGPQSGGMGMAPPMMAPPMMAPPMMAPPGMAPPGMAPPGMAMGGMGMMMAPAGGIQSTTRQFKLSKMFNPATETDPEWDLDIKDAVLEECIKSGPVVHIFVDKAGQDGNVYVKFTEPTASLAAFNALRGRKFGDDVVVAEFMDDAAYNTQFPDAATAVTPLAVAP